MTSSGISISKILDAAFAAARRDNNVRFLECDVIDEALTVTHEEKVAGSAEEQWASMHERMLPKTPHVFLFRLDTQNADLGFGFVFVSYVPDGSPVRKRMLFASSKELCKKELGASYFVHDLSGSQPDELTWAAFQAHVADGKKLHVDDLYSKSEKALIREAVQEVDMGSSNAHAVRFPASDDARAALASGDRLVVLSLDIAKETIELVSRAAQAGPSDLPAHLEKDPRFVVFRWEHDNNGATVDSKVFVYYCPESAPVKSKMMYSTVKSIAVELAGKVDLKLEVTELEGEQHDLSEESLLKALHPVVAEARVSNRVTKPKGPGRPRQLIK